MPNTPEALLKRLDEIGAAVAATGKGIAVIGLGSVGIETDRIDKYSDLDFFVIVQDGQRDAFLNDMSWMESSCSLAWYFMNTVDGYKALYKDGIFCEMAVFDESKLQHIPFSPGRIIWKAEGISENIAIPDVDKSGNPPATNEWILGEALTNLYVGLCRYHRGEKVSALRFIQSYAFDRLLDLAERTFPNNQGFPDTFDSNRRFEQRFPQLADQLPLYLAGYEDIQTSARAILNFLITHFDVNASIRTEIEKLL